jgi:hypothetical protein
MLSLEWGNQKNLPDFTSGGELEIPVFQNQSAFRERELDFTVYTPRRSRNELYSPVAKFTVSSAQVDWAQLRVCRHLRPAHSIR